MAPGRRRGGAQPAPKGPKKQKSHTGAKDNIYKVKFNDGTIEHFRFGRTNNLFLDTNKANYNNYNFVEIIATIPHTTKPDDVQPFINNIVPIPVGSEEQPQPGSWRIEQRPQKLTKTLIEQQAKVYSEIERTYNDIILNNNDAFHYNIIITSVAAGRARQLRLYELAHDVLIRKQIQKDALKDMIGKLQLAMSQLINSRNTETDVSQSYDTTSLISSMDVLNNTMSNYAMKLNNQLITYSSVMKELKIRVENFDGTVTKDSSKDEELLSQIILWTDIKLELMRPESIIKSMKAEVVQALFSINGAIAIFATFIIIYLLLYIFFNSTLTTEVEIKNDECPEGLTCSPPKDENGKYKCPEGSTCPPKDKDGKFLTYENQYNHSYAFIITAILTMGITYIMHKVYFKKLF